MTVHRALLPDGVGRDAVDEAAEALDWRLVNVHAASGDQPRRVFYVAANGEGWLTLVEDPAAGPYLEVAGHDADTLLSTAVGQLGERTRDEVLSGRRRDFTRALAQLAVARPNARDAEFWGVVAEGEAHPDPSVRHRAATLRERAADAPSSGAPTRPRLAASTHCGRHVGEDGIRVVLLDVGAGIRVQIDEAHYRLLTFCDGTRDLDDLCLAAAREGIYGGVAGIRAFIEELHDAGLLRDGLPIPQPPPPVKSPAAAPDRPLRRLPDYRFHCDGRGSCCRFYGMVAFDPDEAREADALAARMHLPLSPPDLFTPFSGAQLSEDAPRVVSQVEGRCLFLERNAGCGLHRIGGPYAKPFPCRMFPTTLVDDGNEVRVSLGPECACVFRSLDSDEGAPLLPDSARTLGDIPAAPWRTVPDPVPLTAREVAPRAQLGPWSDAVCATLSRVEDVPTFLFALSTRLASTFDAPERIQPWTTLPEGTAARIDARLLALAVRAERAADERTHVYLPGALATRVARWMARTLKGARYASVRALPHRLRDERFYVRSLAFGHRLSHPGRTLADGLFDRGVRLLAARAMEVDPIDDEAASPALALLEAAMRNLSLADYAERIAQPS